jgi:hypothetical protein
MKFELKEVASGKFRVMCGTDTVGSISVEENEIEALLKCWSGSTDCLTKSKPQAKMSSQKSNSFVAALTKAAKANTISYQSVLRSC